jgi:hypothetical protein
MEPISLPQLGSGLLRLGLVAGLMYVGYLLVNPDEPADASASAWAPKARPPAFVPVVVAPPPPAEIAIAAPEPPPAAKLDPAPLRRDELSELQAWLKVLGFEPGPIDGLPGPLTTAAIRRYQAARHQEETGSPDRYLLQLIRREVGHGR